MNSTFFDMLVESADEREEGQAACASGGGCREAETLNASKARRQGTGAIHQKI